MNPENRINLDFVAWKSEKKRIIWWNADICVKIVWTELLSESFQSLNQQIFCMKKSYFDTAT